MAITRRVQLHKMSRRIANASWLWDMIELKRVLVLCSRCRHGMPERWEKTFHYQRWNLYGEEFCFPCDSCRQEDRGVMYRSTDTPWFAQVERENRQIATSRASSHRAGASVS